MADNENDLKKRKGVLDEDEYLEKLEKIIKRDFFPELHTIEKFKNKEVKDDDVLDQFTLNSYMSTHNSKDNLEFNAIIKKQDEKYKKRFEWAFPSEK